jgi:hypothetical protein
MRFRELGFTSFVHTVDGEEVEIAPGLRIAIHVETSITDGPGGDSAIVVSDGTHRVVNQNDCRTHDLTALRAHGPVDVHFLQFSGAIWYPMVYEAPAEQMRRLVDAKVESQFTRALRYVEALGAAHVVPSAGPPCFLDDDLFGFNIVSGDELSIFPDQTAFLARLTAAGNVGGVLNIPGTVLELTDHELVVSHPLPDNEVRAIFTDKERYLRRYQADWSGWLSAHRASWEVPETDLVAELAAWWEPLLAMAPKQSRQDGGADLWLRQQLAEIKRVPLEQVGRIRMTPEKMPSLVDVGVILTGKAPRHVADDLAAIMRKHSDLSDKVGKVSFGGPQQVNADYKSDSDLMGWCSHRCPDLNKKSFVLGPPGLGWGRT